MRAALDAVLRRFIVEGRLTVRYPDGKTIHYSGGPGPEAGVELRTAAAVRHILFDPAVGAGQCFTDGTLRPYQCTLFELMEVLMHNHQIGGRHLGNDVMAGLRRALRPWAQWNPIRRSRRNVQHHYDLGDQLYGLFLDSDWQYSCAYFPTGSETLEQAQEAKKRHIAAKLLLDRPGLSVLDIGCGWGGMALTLARDHGARVLGITLSDEQLARARARAEAEGLADRVRFELWDYRSQAVRNAGPFDRVVSVGMFEHVGVTQFAGFFRAVQRLMQPAGIGLLHAIGRSDGPSATNPWLARHIFPGGYSPALSEVFPAVERSGLIVTDLEILRLHYAETLRHWRRRFMARREDAAALYDERFCRMFEMYLTGSELAFRRQDHMVWQMQFSASRTAVPLTRNYTMDPPASAEAGRPDRTILRPSAWSSSKP